MCPYLHHFYCGEHLNFFFLKQCTRAQSAHVWQIAERTGARVQKRGSGTRPKKCYRWPIWEQLVAHTWKRFFILFQNLFWDEGGEERGGRVVINAPVKAVIALQEGEWVRQKENITFPCEGLVHAASHTFWLHWLRRNVVRFPHYVLLTDSGDTSHLLPLFVSKHQYFVAAL